MNNKSIILAGSIAVFLFFVAIGWWILSPAWVLLFPHPVSEPSQQSILLLLNQKNIEYKLDSAKNTILVKSSDLKKAQIMLAENGQPEEQTAGLEVFNSSDYGLSEFAQNINYQRGMEEELARTVKKLKGIKDARIHLTIKKDSLFEDRKQPPKASVVVTPHSGQILNASSIRGVQEIVAAAVPNLEPQQVVIVTDTGVVLSSNNSDSLQQDSLGIEEKYSQRIAHLLAGILDENEYKTSVNVIVDNKKKVTVEENYYPDMNTGKGFLTKKKVTEKSAADVNVSGVPQVNKSNEEEFVYSKERSEIIYPTGEIVKVTVGIVINKSLSEVDKESITKLIFNSLGMIESRGDKISLFASGKVESSRVLPVVDTPTYAPESRALDVPKDYIASKIYWILAGLFVFLGLFILFFILYIRSIIKNKSGISEFELNKLSNDLRDWMHSS
jgi:flagellar M-ring protein FliF